LNDSMTSTRRTLPPDCLQALKESIITMQHDMSNEMHRA
jgi:hypothetical protein